MLIGAEAEEYERYKEILQTFESLKQNQDMITNIEPSTSEFLMSVDIVGCPAKKALYSQDEPEVMHKEVHKNHVHQGYQHHGHQCAKHR